MIVNILNHSNTQKKYIPNFCQITPTSYLKRAETNFLQTILTTGLESADTKPFWKYVRSQKQEHFGITALRSKSTLSDMHHRKTYVYINFQQNRVSRSVKTVHTNLFIKICKCINLQLAIRISKNHAFRTCTTPSQIFRPILRSIGLLDNKLPQKRNYFNRRTDR